MVSVLDSSVVDHVFIEYMIYHTWVEHTNHYTTNEYMIYHTWVEHTNHYTTNDLPHLSLAH
jgi:hypothetical protein